MDSACNRDPTLELYIRAVENDINSSLGQVPNHCPYDNLSEQEREALHSLRNQTNTVVKPVDKGLAVVIMYREDCEVKVLSHVQDGKYYQKLNYDLTDKYTKEVTSFLVDMMTCEVIDKDTVNYPQPRTSWFCLHPKIHKEGVPGRLIVSHCRV